VLDKNKPKIQTVVNKIDAIHNDYRTMQLEVLAGNHSLVTMVVENGLRFHVDLAAVYVHFTCNIIEHSTEIFRCLFFSSLAENQLKRHFFLLPSQSGICIIQFSVFIILCF
jgi:c-di-GMP-binding flagellar brake protein YcgR